MNIVRAIQEKYSLEDGYTEYRKLNTSRGDTSGEFVKSGIQHFIDVKDRLNIWSKGNVNTITYNVAECIWTLKIDYPNWGSAAEEEYTVSIEQERHRSIAPYQTYLPEEGKIFNANPDEIDDEEDTTPICRVTVYISSEKESLRGYHRWFMGELRRDFSIKTCNKRTKYRIFKCNEYSWFTSPCNSTSRDRAYKHIFDKLETQIVENIKAKKKKIAKEKKDAIKKLKDDEKVVLNKYTLEYCSNNNKIVKKRCHAFKKGWVNILGVPQTWAESQSLIKNMHTYCYRYLSTFLSGKDIQKLLCVNKKQHADIRDIHFLKSQVKELRNNIAIEKKQRTITRKNYDGLRRPIDSIDKSIDCLKKINDPKIEVLMKQLDKIVKEKMSERGSHWKKYLQQSYRLQRMERKEKVMYLMY